MTERDLRKLNRSDLLEMLLSLSRENEDLRHQLESARAQLNDRMIRVEKAGSLAEAALQLNGIFEAAQAACEQYAQNIRWRSEHQEQICIEMERETRRKCDRMLAEAKLQAAVYKTEAARRGQQQSVSDTWMYDLMGETPRKNDKNGAL